MTAKVSDLLTAWTPADGPVRWTADVSHLVRQVPTVVVP